MPISYRDAGVDIDTGNELVQRIKPLAAATRTAHVLGKVGGFGGLCGLPPGLSEPVLVSGTDGVGTKLKLAFASGVHNTVGIDLVAMCVNDILTVGAAPLFFLDYFATGKLSLAQAEAVVAGVAAGCRQAGCALLGGETAEMPDMYAPGEYDLAGFVVGVVERAKLLAGKRVRAGDTIVAVASSGLHSNGYSLARKVLFDKAGLALSWQDPCLEGSLGEELMKPTRIYAKACAALFQQLGPEVHALAHITGGGLLENVPRCLPDDCAAFIDLGSYARPALFGLIARTGPVTEEEMRRTFNLGVGLTVVVAPQATATALATLQEAGEHAWVLGQVQRRAAGPAVTFGPATLEPAEVAKRR